MARKSSPPQIHHPQSQKVTFLADTMYQGWWLATEDDPHSVASGTHGYVLAVSPQGHFGTVHWRTSNSPSHCEQVSTPWSIDCFGGFEASFLPPIQTISHLIPPFQAILPQLEMAYQLWLTAPRLSWPEKIPICVSGDPQKDLQMRVGTSAKSKQIFDTNRVIEATYDILQSQTADADALLVLQNALASSYSSAWSWAADTLIVLSHYYPEAGEYLINAMSHKQAATRLHTVQSLFSHRPLPHISMAICRSGLKDKSSSVRRFTGDRLVLLELRDLLPDIDQAIFLERDPDTQYKLRYNRSQLKYGIAVEFRNESYHIWVCRTSGGSSSSSPIPADQFNWESLQAYVAHHGGSVEKLEGWTLQEVLVPVA